MDVSTIVALRTVNDEHLLEDNSPPISLAVATVKHRPTADDKSSADGETRAIKPTVQSEDTNLSFVPTSIANEYGRNFALRPYQGINWSEWQSKHKDVQATALSKPGKTDVAMVYITDRALLTAVKGIASGNVHFEDTKMKLSPSTAGGCFMASYTTKRVDKPLQYLMIDQVRNAVLRPVTLSVEYRTQPLNYPNEWEDRLDKTAELVVDWDGSIAKNHTDLWIPHTDNAAFNSTQSHFSLLPGYVPMQVEEANHQSPAESDEELDLDKYLPSELKVQDVASHEDPEPESQPEGGLPEEEPLVTMPVPHFFYIPSFSAKTTLLEANFPDVATCYIKTSGKWFDQAHFVHKGSEESCQVVPISVKVTIQANTKRIASNEILIDPVKWNSSHNLSANLGTEAGSQLKAPLTTADNASLDAAWGRWLARNSSDIPQIPHAGWSPSNVKDAVSRILPTLTEDSEASVVMYTPSESNDPIKLEAPVDSAALSAKLQKLKINSGPAESLEISRKEGQGPTGDLQAAVLSLTIDTPSVRLSEDYAYSDGSLGAATPIRSDSAGDDEPNNRRDNGTVFLPRFGEDGAQDTVGSDAASGLPGGKLNGTLHLTELDSDPSKPSHVRPGSYLTTRADVPISQCRSLLPFKPPEGTNERNE